jgi:membrane dipeptidase
MSEWGISREAAELHRNALVWDMTLPIITPGTPEQKARVFSRSAAAGVDYQSITLAIDGMDFRAAGHQLAIHRRMVAERADSCVLVNSAQAIREARKAGKLAVGFHF